jgi:hypothetical protein
MDWTALSSREWASVFWLGVLLVAGVVTPSVRKAFAPVLRTFVRFWQLHLAVLALLAWAALVCYVGNLLGAWSTDLLKDTIAWVLVYGMASIFAALKAAKEEHFFRRSVLAVVSVAAVMQFMLNLHTLNFVIELFLQPLVTILVLVEGVAGREARTRPAQRFINALLGIVGVWVVLATANGLWDSWRGIDPKQTGLAFAFSLWFPLTMLPFVYALSLVLTYGATFSRAAIHNEGWEDPPVTVKAAIMAGLHGDVRAVNDLPRHPAEFRSIVRSESFREAVANVRAYQDAREDRRREKEAKAARLVDMAGIKGTDDEGKVLDQREMKATKEALRWVQTWHLGHYNNTGKYRKDLMSAVLLNDFTQQGLAEGHGITMRVGKDRQAWYAWRRTPSGQVLGIGMNDGRDNEWLYDSEQPPVGFPGQDPSWGDKPYETPPNWK